MALAVGAAERERERERERESFVRNNVHNECFKLARVALNRTMTVYTPPPPSSIVTQ